MPLSMIFTVICPSDTSGRRKGGLITIVFSFFGLPKYLSVKNKRAFIDSFLCIYRLPTLCKAFYTRNSPTRPVKRLALNWFLWFHDELQQSKASGQIPSSRHSGVNLTLNSQRIVTIIPGTSSELTGPTEGWHVSLLQVLPILRESFLKAVSHQTSPYQKKPKDDKSFDQGWTLDRKGRRTWVLGNCRVHGWHCYSSHWWKGSHLPGIYP